MSPQGSIARQLIDKSFSNLYEKLHLDKCFEAHSGCVNCLDWNESGNLLASGSDDGNIIIYSPFRKTHSQNNVTQQLSTSHIGNIFSIKFMPLCNDSMIVSCGGDNHVKLISTITNQDILNCENCHQKRAKSVAVHPQNPNLIWSAGEDGYILEYDIRQEHVCTNEQLNTFYSRSKPNNILIDLKNASLHGLMAKCIAVNPVRQELLAVGSTDPYIRMLDRRYVRRDNSNFSAAYFSPGHYPYQQLGEQLRMPNECALALGATHLTFNRDGSELLCNYNCDQVYLFNTYEPLERFKSFGHDLEPLIYDFACKQQVDARKQKSFNINPIIFWDRLRQRRSRSPLPEEHVQFYERMMKKLKTNETLTKDEFEEINSLIYKTINCPELYHLRAAHLLQRGWKGDQYEALRDSCSSLAFNPLDIFSYKNLARLATLMRSIELASGVLRAIELVQKEILDLADNGVLDDAKATIKSLLDSSTSSSPTFWCSDSTDRYRSLEVHRIVQSAQRLPRDIALDDIYGSYKPSAEDCQNIIEPKNVNVDIYEAEIRKRDHAFDYNKRFLGHCNLNTDIKQANFFGNHEQYIVAGSDDGAFYLWNKNTTNLVKAVAADYQILNCVQPHPFRCMLATSGIQSCVKLWSPNGTSCFDVQGLEQRCAQNQVYVSSDPMEAIIMMISTNRELDQDAVHGDENDDF